MEEMIVKFRKSSGNKKTGEDIMDVMGSYISLQDRQEAALIINFKAPQDEINKIEKFFQGVTDLEPIFLDLDDTGEVGYYFRGTTSPEKIDDLIYKFSVTLQLRRGSD